MKRISLFLALAALFSLSSARAETAAPNLLANGDFETTTENAPAHWQFGSANPEIFKTEIAPDTKQNHALELTAWNDIMSGYWAQQIAVKPNTTYRIDARVKQSAGKMLIYITGGEGDTRLDARIYVVTLENQPMFPLFWKADWITGTKPFPAGTDGKVVALKTVTAPDTWTNVSRTFETGPLDSVAVNLGAFFAAGDYWFDDVRVTEVSP